MFPTPPTIWAMQPSKADGGWHGRREQKGPPLHPEFSLLTQVACRSFFLFISHGLASAIASRSNLTPGDLLPFRHRSSYPYLSGYSTLSQSAQMPAEGNRQSITASLKKRGTWCTKYMKRFTGNRKYSLTIDWCYLRWFVFMSMWDLWACRSIKARRFDAFQ